MTLPFKKQYSRFLAKNCYSCHNEKLKTANLSLEEFHDAASAARQPEVWNKVLDKLSTGKMPPPGLPPIAKAEVAVVTSWIEGVVKQPKANRESDPGRVTAHRLNRVEYNNTIRDLLSVSVHPADDFPVDDSGYGFDNISDVLSVSPMLMEKYMAAANQVARLAVFGETLPARPSKLVRLLNARSGDVSEKLPGSRFAYSLRGAMYGNFVFPADGEYEFRIRVANFRGDTAEERLTRTDIPEEAKAQVARKASPPEKLVLAVDGSPIMSRVFETAAIPGAAAGERFVPEFVARAPVKAGERFLRASFPDFADRDPSYNITPRLRRGLFVDYMDIIGPFNPGSEPSPSYQRIFVCGHPKGEHRPECARLIVENLVRRAYRRPVTMQEVDAKLRLVSLAQKEGDSLEEGVRLALKAILVSPNFLFRAESDPPQGSKEAATPHLVNEFELASRLSYFLWSSMPDEELFRVAREQKLRRPGVLAAQVRRMLADPKAKNLVDNFAAQWLQMRNLGRVKPDPGRFPTVDDELVGAMRRETSLFVEAMIREDRSVLDFTDAPFTYVNGPLARHYGIAGITGEEFQRVKLDGEQRGGLLTQGAVLTVSSYPTRTSPPVRGKWVLENLLGAAPPPPPPDVPVLDDSKIGAAVSMRERLEQHRKDPSCSPCHNMMDPIGLGLENYDAVGVWRTFDGKMAIDTSGTMPDGKSFKGVKDLKQILKSQSGAFTRHLTENLLMFALGRGIERYDEPVVAHISEQVAANGYRFSALVMEIVNSKPFQMRSGEGVKQ